MTTKEKNELIAKWMGWEITGSGPNRYVITHKLPSPYPSLTNASHRIEDMKFHCDWRWLMPVIEDISKMEYDHGEKSYPRTFGMTSEEGSFMFRFNLMPLHRDESLISAAYSAVVEFVISSGVSVS